MADVTKTKEELRGTGSREEARVIESDDGRRKRSECVCRVHFYLFWETAPLTKRPDKRIRRGIEETIGYLLADVATEEGEREAEKSGIP